MTTDGGGEDASSFFSKGEIMMEHETYPVSLSDDELIEIKLQLEQWKEEHGNIYITEFDNDISFVWRCLTRTEFKKAMEYYEDPYDRAEYVCRICVLDPVDVDYELEAPAGIPEVLTENILQQSGFGEDTGELEELMTKFDNEMYTFNNQISCVIVEAFPQFDIEEVEDWNLEKMLWYYSRAKWILKTLRGIELVKEDGAGAMAPDGTVVKGDPKDFPELV